MDSKRQGQPQNAANEARPRPTAVDALRYAAEAKSPDRPPKLGEILVAQGQITPEQLAAALKSQRSSGRRLGEELIQAGYVKRSVVSRALRIQRRITFAAMCSTLAVSTIAPAVQAAQQRGQIAVSAFVPAQAVGEVVQQPAQITITDAEIGRAHV